MLESPDKIMRNRFFESNWEAFIRGLDDPASAKELVISKLICKLLHVQKAFKENELQFYESKGIYLGKSGFAVLVFNIDEDKSYSDFIGGDRPHSVMCKQLNDLCGLILSSRCVSYSTEIDDKVAVLICCLQQEKAYVDNYRGVIYEYCSEIAELAESRLGIVCNAKISAVVNDIFSISTVFHELCNEIDFQQFTGTLTERISHITALPEINRHEKWLRITDNAYSFVDCVAKLDPKSAELCVWDIIDYLCRFKPLSNVIFFHDLQSFFDSAEYMMLQRGFCSERTLSSVSFSQSIHRSGSLNEMIAKLSSDIAYLIESSTRYKSDAVLQRMIDIQSYILDHYADYSLSISSIAEHFKISVSLLSQQFKSTFGQPPSSFIEETRLDSVKKQLSSTDMSVEEICGNTGFGSVSTLHRAFYRKFGQSPGQYRNKMRS